MCRRREEEKQEQQQEQQEQEQQEEEEEEEQQEEETCVVKLECDLRQPTHADPAVLAVLRQARCTQSETPIGAAAGGLLRGEAGAVGDLGTALQAFLGADPFANAAGPLRVDDAAAAGCATRSGRTTDMGTLLRGKELLPHGPRRRPARSRPPPRLDAHVWYNTHAEVRQVGGGVELGAFARHALKDGALVPFPSQQMEVGDSAERAGTAVLADGWLYVPCWNAAGAYVNDAAGPVLQRCERAALIEDRANVDLVECSDQSGALHLAWEVQRSVAAGEQLLGDYGAEYWREAGSHRYNVGDDGPIVQNMRLRGAFAGSSQALAIELEASSSSSSSSSSRE